MNAALCNALFDQCIEDYHVHDDPDADESNPHRPEDVEFLLYRKAHIDTVQWHLEDRVRDPELAGDEIRELKRRIDQLNQWRTDTVERLDDWFAARFRDAPRQPEARQNSETPAWIVDRLSILALKVYHWREQVNRTDVLPAHREHSAEKLAILLEQRADLSRAFDELLEDLAAGRRFAKVYRQLKMYNDHALNPVLYGREGRRS